MPSVGTIAFVAHRKDFVVLAADKLSVFIDTGGPPIFTLGNKILAHPKLPLAIMTSSLASVEIGPYPNRQEESAVETYILDEYHLLKSPQQISLEWLMQFSERVLLPLVKNQCLYTTNDKMAGVPSFARLHFGLMNGSVPICGTVNISETVDNDERENCRPCLAGPNSLREFYSREFRGGNNEWIHGVPFNRQEALIRHARNVVLEGITKEQAIVRNEDRRCGGGVDVVIVDSRGARLAYSELVDENDLEIRPGDPLGPLRSSKKPAS
jgi:hypothetical protein